jgi:hypothetical protein
VIQTPGPSTCSWSRATWRAGLAVTLSLVAAGCAGNATSDRAAILKVMETGRAALLAGDGPTACRLLTAGGRRRSLGFNVDFDEEGSIPPSSPRLPQTCEDLLRREAREGGIPRRDIRLATFAIASVEGSRATVRLTAPNGTTVGFTLRKAQGRWRMDDSDAIPSGH